MIYLYKLSRWKLFKLLLAKIMFSVLSLSSCESLYGTFVALASFVACANFSTHNKFFVQSFRPTSHAIAYAKQELFHFRFSFLGVFLQLDQRFHFRFSNVCEDILHC